MKKAVEVETTRSLVRALICAVHDEQHKDTRAIVEALSQETGVNLPPDWER